MPKIFEIFGYPIDDTSPEATENRRAARCPFMGRECDGGGNRYSSNVVVQGNEALEAFLRTPLRPSLGRLIEILAQRKPVNEVIMP